MGYLTPAPGGLSVLSADDLDTSTAGVTLTANATPNTENTAFTDLVASTTGDSYGLFVMLGGMAVNTPTTALSGLVDIAIGAASSEVVIINDLQASQSGAWGTTRNQFPHSYYFPLYIPASTRISARLLANTASDTCTCKIYTVGRSKYGDQFIGQKVTTYGAVVANSKGTNVTAGNSNAYGTSAQLSSSTADRIKYMQIGTGTTDLALTAARVIARIMSGTDVIVEGLPFQSNPEGEIIDPTMANMILSRMAFDIPSGVSLDVASMSSLATGEVHDYIIYGVS